MSYRLWTIMAAGVALLALGACSDGGGGGGGVANFGPVFQKSFAGNGNDEPINPQAGDLPAVDPTKEPIDF